MSTPDDQHSDDQDRQEGREEKLAGLINRDHQARRRHAYGLVRLMKSLRVILPVIVILLLALIYNFADFRGQTPVKTATGEEDTDKSNRNALINPRFESRDAADRPFTITADKAFQPEGQGDEQAQSLTITSADTIHLQAPMGDIALDNGAWLAVKGKRGIYRRDAETLALHDSVHIFHDSGYELRTNALHVDIAQATAHSDVPVTVTGPKGKIDAEGMKADDKAGTVIFHGPARLEMKSDMALP